MSAVILKFRRRAAPRPRLVKPTTPRTGSDMCALIKSYERAGVPWGHVKTWLELNLGYVNFKLLAEHQKKEGSDHA